MEPSAEFAKWLAAVIGPAALIGGLAGYLGAVIKDLILHWRTGVQQASLEQLKNEYAAELERLRNQLGHVSLVHRAKFETEFAATRDVWAAVSVARSKGTGLRPSAHVAPLNETDDERLARFRTRQQAFREARNQLVKTLDEHAPFLAPEVFASADAVRVTVVQEDLDAGLAHPEPFSFEWFDRGDDAATQLRAQVDALADTIRRRFDQMLVPEKPGAGASV
jgi:hypothetical protein